MATQELRSHFSSSAIRNALEHNNPTEDPKIHLCEPLPAHMLYIVVEVMDGILFATGEEMWPQLTRCIISSQGI